MKQIVTIFALLVCFAAQAYEPLVREDRVWEYYERGEWDKLYTESTSYLTKFKFDGTQEINGITYHQYKFISYTSWHFKINYPTGEVVKEPGDFDKPMNHTVALLREEDGVVYWFKDKGESENDPNKEVVLYDFRHQPGEDFVAWGINYKDCNYEPVFAEIPYQTVSVNNLDNWPGRYFVFRNMASVESDKLNGYDWASRFGDDFADVKIVEGIGNVGLGDFLNPDHKAHFILTGNSSEGRRDNPDEASPLNNVYDLDGNVIYPGANIKNPFAGVETVGADAEEGDGRMFDLMGRELRGEPARGTLYIQNGRKHIAR